MKRLILIILVVPLLLAACSTTPSSSSGTDSSAAIAPASNQDVTPQPSGEEALSTEVITTDYDDATSVRNQLAFGTMKLDGTAQAVTAEQAKTLLPLWQAMSALSGNTSTVPEELNAVQNQIFASMTPEQLQAIADLQITNAKISEFYAEKGIVLPTMEPGVTRNPGAMKDLPEADREATKAARQASGEVSGAGAGAGQLTKTLLYDEVVKYLGDRVAE